MNQNSTSNVGQCAIMTNYVYECNRCGRFDIRLERGEHITKCPTCSAPVKKVYQVGGVIYRGDGFYSTGGRNDDSTRL